MNLNKYYQHIKQKLFKEKSLYQQIGEHEGISTLVKNFYDAMENDPKARECLLAHETIENKVPQEVKRKLIMFLSGWLGGPNLFVEEFGHPRMRARHIKVKVTVVEAEQWLYCMQNALESHPKKLKKKFKVSFINSCTALAQRIINS